MRIRIHHFFIQLLFFCLIPVHVFGVVDTFPVRTLVGSDTEAPTVPTGLTATGISTSQIDLSWSSSTDNFAFSGYHIWRQEVSVGTTTTTSPPARIATTTIPSYSDTGLSPATSYVYYVTAFDSSFNVSASSSVATGTTLSVPPPAEEESETDRATVFGSKRRTLEDQLVSLQVYPDKDSVSIQFSTDWYVRTVIRWGTSDAYELGVLGERVFSKQHETTIVGLLPGTRYMYTIEGELPNGKIGTVHTGSFMTLPPDDVTPPGNVTQLRGIAEGDSVLLSWNNPLDQDFAYVRVVRNDRFFPNDTADGWVIYEGTDIRFVDIGAFVHSPVQYYTVFAYDELGNISSGAVVAVSRDGRTQVVVPDVTKNDIELTFERLEFYQDGSRLLIADGSVIIDGTKQLTIRAPYELFPEHLKTILVTLTHPTNAGETFSFLLRINGEKTAYESILAPFGIGGAFPVRLSVFDYETQQIGFTEGLIIAHIGARNTTESGVFLPYDSESAPVVRTVVLILIGILGFLLCIWLASKLFIVVRK